MEFLLRLWARLTGPESIKMNIKEQAVDVGQHLYRIYDTSMNPECIRGEVHVRPANDSDGIPREAEWHARRRAKDMIGHDNFRLEDLTPKDEGPIYSGIRRFTDLFR